MDAKLDFRACRTGLTLALVLVTTQLAAPRLAIAAPAPQPPEALVAQVYHRLIVAAMTAVGDFPALPGSREVAKVAELRTLHLRSMRRLVTPAHRVREPRHLLIYRVAPDGVVEILSLLHDRMLLARAARRARREADG